MNIRTIIADDEPLARERLEALMRADPEFEIVQLCRNGREVVQALTTMAVDLVMLDVRMPGLDGLEAMREIGARKLPMVVFVTAYDRFAVDAFRIQAVDYLVKPIEVTRFREAIERVKARARMEDALLTEERFGSLLNSLKPSYMARVLVRSGAKEFFVSTADIMWIEAADYYVCVHAGDRKHLVRTSIKSLETKLDPKKFARIHRSAIVNVDFVREIHREGRAEGWVLLANGDRPPMSPAGWRKLLALAV